MRPPTPERLAQIRDRRGEAISPDEHACNFDWCQGTIWRGSHLGNTIVLTTGRRSDVVEEREVTVQVGYDDTEDSQPQVLLHLCGADESEYEVCPTARQARQIAMALLAGAQALDDFR